MIPQLALALAPTAINLGMNLFGNKKKSRYERDLGRMADMFSTEASKPITENLDFKAGKKVMDKRDASNRRSINNQSAVVGSTDESKMGMIGRANESYDSNINRLLQSSQRYRDLMRNRELQSRGMMDQAKQARNERFGSKVNAITQGVGAASNAFLMSSVFDPSKPQAQTPTSGFRIPQKQPLPRINYGSVFNSGAGTVPKHAFNWASPG